MEQGPTTTAPDDLKDKSILHDQTIIDPPPGKNQENEHRKKETLTNEQKLESKTHDTYSDKKNSLLKQETTSELEQNKTIEQANINDHSSRFVGAGLWEQLREHTRNIEIEEESDFYWPEDRKYTEAVIDQLYAKHILFIQSISEDWLFKAVQRLASVLHTSMRFENLLVRITRNDSIEIGNQVSGQLQFGFWTGQRRLPYPVVIFISSSRYDFLQKFLDQRKETVLIEFISELKKLNLYLVCEVENSVPNQELFSKSKRWIKDVYAFWKIPVVKLQIIQTFSSEGIELFKTLEDTGVIAAYDEYRIFGEIIKQSYKTPDDVLNDLPKHLSDTVSEVDSKKESLITLMKGDDFIKQVVIFCGAFFNGLYYPDFFGLVSELLEGETNDVKNIVDTLPKSGFTSVSAPSVQLQQLWEQNADRYLKECMLKTIRESGNQRVDFIVSRLSNEMSKYIGDEQYPFFHRIYKKFEKAGLLTNLGLSEKLESYIIRFFALAARMDTNTHNAWWLKNIVYVLWRGYAEELTTSDSYEKMVNSLRRRKAFAEIVFDRIPLIISGLLTHNNEEYREIIKQFFRLLLNEHDAKKMAIIIASYLYKEYRLTETFSSEDLMSYFRRTLEEGNWEESFFSYDALVDNMSYTELWHETIAWIDNREISDNSWTKQFAYLYQLDFILETFYRYFRQFKGEGLYELWENSPEGNFPDSFRLIMQRLLSDPCQKSLATILQNEQNSGRFNFRVKLLEGIESDKIILINTRLLPPYNTALTLIADVLEIWFYLLTHKKDTLKSDSQIEPIWEIYIQLIGETCDQKTISKLKKYWMAKIDFYSLIIQAYSEEKQAINNQNSYKKQIQKRRASLRMLKDMLQHLKF